MSDSSISTPATTFNLHGLPNELVSRVFDFYAGGKLTPLRFYSFWERGDFYEEYRNRLPTQLSTPECQPRWLNEEQEHYLVVMEPERQPHDHALLHALPQFSDEYLAQVFRNTLVVVDLDVGTLRDPTEWFEAAAREPLPVFGARNLYVRLASTRQLRNLDQTTRADLNHLVTFLKRFPNLEFLSVDGVARDYLCQRRTTGHCFDHTCTECFVTAHLPLQDLLLKPHFRNLRRVLVVRQNWVWDDSAGRFVDKGRLANYGTRQEWRSVQRRSAKVAHVKALILENRQKRWERGAQGQSDSQ
jgi:hypothetical protein